MRTTGFDPTSRFGRMIMEVRFGAAAITSVRNKRLLLLQ